MTQHSRSKSFHFKQFSIQQDGCGMPVSTDGVLLGAWFRSHNANHILDIGCGTGLLSLMAAQRFPYATITAIDIDATAITTSKLNVQHSPWPERIKVQHKNVLTLNAPIPFDSIVCNPPYFTNGEVAEQKARATARHTESFNHFTLLDHCYRLLSKTGYASFILPIEQANTAIDYALRSGWCLSRSWPVKPTKKKPSTRLLFELTKQKYSETEIDSIMIQDEGTYSQKFIHLTRSFYLKM